MRMSVTPRFETRLARDQADVAAALGLRYRIFVRELGGGGAGVDHAAEIERDEFDAHAEHLLLIDHARENAPVVGVYRLLTESAAERAGRFYSAEEYDLSPLLRSGRRLLELGRSCLDRDYRGGVAMMHLWQALAGIVRERQVEVLFGVASFHGTDVAALAPSLSLLAHRHLAPVELRPRSRIYQPMDLVDETRIDRVAAMVAMPALIKAYLRLGGFVGDGAYVDRAFNTVDVSLILDTTRLNLRHQAIYSRGPGGAG